MVGSWPRATLIDLVHCVKSLQRALYKAGLQPEPTRTGCHVIRCQRAAEITS